jgi:uncharacterized protein (DUF111 family)
MQMKPHTSSMTTMAALHHAHWDCSQGISTASMLGACLDASSMEMKEKLEHDLDELCRDIFPTDKIHSQAVTTGLGKAITCYNSTMSGLVSDRSLLLVLDISIKSGRLGLLPRVIASLQKAELVVTDYAAAFQLELQSLFEIVCILLLLEYVNVETFSCSALPMGEGHIEKDGGYMPVPSPSTLNLMLGMRTCSGPRGITGELVSCCACALLREMTMSGDMQGSVPPVFIPEHVGLGTNANGSQTIRLILGRSDSEPEPIHNLSEVRDVPWKTDSLTLLEANLDDTTAEALAFAVEVLLSNGALDAWVTPIVMKKGRAAHTLHCLCSDSDIHKSLELLELMFRHTTTLGVRINRDVERAALRRSFASVQTPYLDQERQGMVDVKIGYLGDEVVSVKPEFDHCRAISLATNVPVQKIVEAAIHEWTKTQDVKQFTNA